MKNLYSLYFKWISILQGGSLPREHLSGEQLVIRKADGKAFAGRKDLLEELGTYTPQFGSSVSQIFCKGVSTAASCVNRFCFTFVPAACMQCVALCMEDFRPVPSGSCCKLKFQHMTSITCLILHLTGWGFWEETSVLGRYSWIEHNFWHMSKKCNFKMTAPPAWPEVAWQCFEARTGFLTHGTCANFWQLTHKLWHLFCALPLPGGKYVNTIISKMFQVIEQLKLLLNYIALVCVYLFLSSTRFHLSSFNNWRKYAKKNFLGNK